MDHSPGLAVRQNCKGLYDNDVKMGQFLMAIHVRDVSFVNKEGAFVKLCQNKYEVFFAKNTVYTKRRTIHRQSLLRFQGD